MGDYLLDTQDIIEDTDRLNGWTSNAQYAIMTDSASMNSTTPRILFYNGLAQMTRGMTHCNFAQDDCWTVRVHPRITTVSFNDGYTTGGQEIHITGVTLNGTNVEVSLGGTPCDIVERDFDFITCVTREADPSPIGYQPGQPGVTYIQNTEDYEEYLQLASTFEVLHLNSSNPISGWFKAPTTGQYRFYISCRNWCQLELGSTPFDPNNISLDEPETTVIASRSGWNAWRDYEYIADDGHYSDWIQLTEGEQYYIYGKVSTERLTVAVEIKPDNATTPVEEHFNAMKAMHQISFEHTFRPEMWEISINNPDAGTYVMTLVDTETKATPQVYTTETISASASASTLKTILNKFYSTVHGADVSVTTLFFDADANEVADASTAVQWKHVITCNKALAGYSSPSIMAQPRADLVKKTAATKAGIAIKLPSEVQSSSTPFNGTMVITCTDNFNKEYESYPMKFDASTVGIEKAMQSIPFLVDKVSIVHDGRFAYRANGISFSAIFNGLDYNPPLCHIAPGGDWPLTGGDDMQSNSTVLRDFGQSIFYPAIPMEMLRTDAQAP